MTNTGRLKAAGLVVRGRIVLRAQYANAITLARLGLAGGVLLAASHSRVALWLLAAAILSDFVDGPLARKLQTASATGERLDRMADRVLAVAATVSLAFVPRVPLWVLVALVCAGLATYAIRAAGPWLVACYLAVAYQAVLACDATVGYGWHTYYLAAGLVLTLAAFVAYYRRSQRVGQTPVL